MAKKRRYSVVRCTTIKCSSAVALKPQIPAKRHLLLTTIYGQPPRLRECCMPRTLGCSFFGRSVHEVAPELVGATLLFAGVGGRVVEVEAYHHTDPAAHSFRGPTARNAVMFGPPGFAYVYRSYGIHALLNAVAEEDGLGAAVLIRAIEPLEGIELMRARRGVRRDQELTNGPGKLTEALAIGLEMNGVSLEDGPIRIEPRPADARPPLIVTGTRIGITKAADLPWRFCDATSPWVSRPWPEAMRTQRSSRAVRRRAA
jgi:DNA-3-methyladenine glycosylase